MDPLSIVASCIAVVQAATASGQGLSKLLSLGKAPAELHALHNEVEALRSLLLLLRHTLLHINESELYHEAREPLNILIRPVQDAVEELHALVEYRLKRNEELNKRGLPKVSKTEWLTADIEGVKRRIRDARDNLDAGIGELTLHHSETNRQVALQIQTITFKTHSDLQEMRHEAAETSQDFRARLTEQTAFHADHQQTLGGLRAELGALSANHLRRSDIIDLRTAQQSDLEQLRLAIAQQQANQAPLGQALLQLRHVNEDGFKTLAASLRHMQVGQANVPTGELSVITASPADDVRHRPQPSDESMVCVTATLATEKCPLGCRCRCHTRTSFKTPPWLKSLLGQLMFDYTALIHAKSCDYPPCRKSPRRSQFTYYFPAWMASRALTVSGLMHDLSGPGASWTIKMPVVVRSGWRVWSAVKDGNIGFLQEYFSRRQYSPYAVDEDGMTFIHVSKLHRAWLLVHLICVAKADPGSCTNIVANKSQGAVLWRRPAVYHFLLSSGADPQLQDRTGWSANSVVLNLAQHERKSYGIDSEAVADDIVFTPLHLAVVLPSSSRSFTSDLLEQQFQSLNEPDRLGRTPLHWACIRDNPAAVTLLLQWDADVSLRDGSGRSALHYACRFGDAACVTALFHAGAAANVVNADGGTPVMNLRDSNAHLVSLLVDHGASLNYQTALGDTALHLAAQHGQGKLVHRLLEAGADPLITGQHGHLPIHMAIIYDGADALSVFLRFCLDVQATDLSYPGLTSSPQPSPPSVGPKVPLAHQDRPYYRRADGVGLNLLHMAALFAGTGVMQILAGADLRGVDPLRGDESGDTPDDCFYRYRDSNCTIRRPPFEEEEAAWTALMASARRQNGVGVESDEDSPNEEDASGEDWQITDDEGDDLADEEDDASDVESAMSEDAPETFEDAAETL